MDYKFYLIVGFTALNVGYAAKLYFGKAQKQELDLAKDPEDRFEKRESNEITESREFHVKNTFAIYDTKGEGKVKADDVLGLFHDLGQTLSLGEQQHLLSTVPKDADGYVTYDTFKKLLEERINLYKQHVYTNF